MTRARPRVAFGHATLRRSGGQKVHWTFCYFRPHCMNGVAMTFKAAAKQA